MDIKNRNNIGLLDIGKKSMYDILTFGNIVFSYHCSISQDLYWSNIGQKKTKDNYSTSDPIPKVKSTWAR